MMLVFQLLFNCISNEFIFFARSQIHSIIFQIGGMKNGDFSIFFFNKTTIIQLIFLLKKLFDSNGNQVENIYFS